MTTNFICVQMVMAVMLIQGGPKIGAIFCMAFLTLPNIDRFSKLFHCHAESGNE